MLKHSYLTPLPNDDSKEAQGLISSNRWNADHSFDGGADGQVLVRNTGAAGGAAWVDASSIATPTTPAGSNGQVQYNNAGAFGGAAGIFYESGNTGFGTTGPLGAKVDIQSTGANILILREPSGGIVGRISTDTVISQATMGRYAVSGSHGTLDAVGVSLDRTQNVWWSDSTVDYGNPDANISRVSAGKLGIGTGTQAGVNGILALAGVQATAVTKTFSYGLTATDSFVFMDTSGGTLTATLPTAIGNSGRVFTVVKTSNLNTLNFATIGSQNINGALPGSVIALGSTSFVSDNTGWWII